MICSLLFNLCAQFAQSRRHGGGLWWAYRPKQIQAPKLKRETL